MSDLLIDADGCPVVYQILEIADEYGLHAVVVCDTSHVFSLENAEVVIVDQGCDHADYAILRRVKEFDIVVTQDYGLAALALGKKAYPISQNGLWYTDENINALLTQRHDSAKLRRASKSYGHMKKRSSSDDDAFCASLIRLIETVMGEEE